MEPTTLPRTRKSSIQHRLRNLRAALSRGDLDSQPHITPNAVQELRRAAGDLQQLASDALEASHRLNDAQTTNARCVATSIVSETLDNVLEGLG